MSDFSDRIKGASGYVIIRGSLIDENKETLTVRGKYSLFEIPTKSIHEKQEITSETEGKILVIKVDPEAKILLSVSRSASEMTGTANCSMFGKGTKLGIGQGDCNCDCACDCECRCECACDCDCPEGDPQGLENRRSFRRIWPYKRR